MKPLLKKGVLMAYTYRTPKWDYRIRIERANNAFAYRVFRGVPGNWVEMKRFPQVLAHLGTAMCIAAMAALKETPIKPRRAA